MRRHFCHGAHFGVWTVQPGFLAVAETPIAWRVGATRRFEVARDARMAAHFARLVRCTGLRSHRLVVLEAAGGVGGLYAPGLIAVALEDTLRIAARIWHTRFVPVNGRTARSLARRGIPVIAWKDLVHRVREIVLAHEVGHAMRRAGVWTSHVHEELAADHLAGWLDAALGRDAELGAMVVGASGCSSPGCSHPPGDRRAEAYLRGYEAYLDARAAREIAG